MSTTFQLRVLVTNLPPEGVTLRGDVSFLQLRIEDDELVSCPYPVQFQLRVTPIMDGVLAQGRLETRLCCRCDRCLGEYEVAVMTQDVCHLFEDVEAGEVDLTEVVREDILLVFPHRHLCRSDCRGLCPGCGQNLNEGVCRCPAPESSAEAWAALDGLDLSSDSPGAEAANGSE